MIRKFSRIHLNSFKDFSWDKKWEGEKKKNRNLPDFARYNLIYGWNGSGKSTISEALREGPGKDKFDALRDGEDSVRELSDKEKFDIVVSGNGKPIPLKQFKDKDTNKIRVFNSDTVRRYVKNIESTEAGVLEVVIGEKNVEKQKKIEKNERDIKEKNELMVQGYADSQKKNNKRILFVREMARIIKEDIRRARLSKSGELDYASPDYERDVEKFDVKKLESVKSTLSEMDEEEQVLKNKFERMNASFPEVIGLIEPLQDTPEEILASVFEALSLNFASEAIEDLKEDAEVARWVSSGMILHNIPEQGERDETTRESCYFCDSPISSERINLLQKHFTDSYRESMKNLQRVINTVKEVHQEVHRMKSAIFSVTIQIHGDLQEQWRRASNIVLNELQNYEGALSKAEEDLSKKWEDLTLSAPKNDSPAIVVDSGPLYDLVDAHNKRLKEQGREEVAIEENLARIIIDRRIIGTYSEYKGLERELLDLEDAIKNHENEIARLEEENVDLRSKMSSKGNSVDELNDQIKRCFFHDDFAFKHHEGGPSSSEKNGIYKLERSGGKVGALSEGERSVISLLYFLLTLSDSGAPLNKTIVVIDDPINNMDYLVNSIVQEEIIKCVKNCRQLFMFTHDYTFFQDFKNRTQRPFESKDKKAYFLEKDGSGSFFLEMPAIFLKHSSEYHYLFYKVYNARARKGAPTPSDKVVPTPPDKEAAYCIGNIARKLLEEFLNFRVPEIKKKATSKPPLYDRFTIAREQGDSKSVDEDTLSLLLDFVHAGSHADRGFKYLPKIPEVCHQMMLFIEGADANHYENMKESLELSD